MHARKVLHMHNPGYIYKPSKLLQEAIACLCLYHTFEQQKAVTQSANCRGRSPLNVMIAVQKYLRLHNGHQAGCLCDGSISGQAVSTVHCRKLAGASWDGYY